MMKNEVKENPLEQIRDIIIIFILAFITEEVFFYLEGPGGFLLKWLVILLK